jgi:uncharacterized protein (DUF302 family)
VRIAGDKAPLNRLERTKHMQHIVDSNKSVAQAAADLGKAVAAGGFGVLHVYDLKQVLESKGVELPNECRIFEVCNPRQASKVLQSDMSLSVALPCRIAVYESAGRTHIATLRPTALLAEISDDPRLTDTAVDVEVAIEAMIDAAAH